MPTRLALKKAFLNFRKDVQERIPDWQAASAEFLTHPQNRHFDRECRNPNCRDSSKLASMALDARFPAGMTDFFGMAEVAFTSQKRIYAAVQHVADNPKATGS